MHPEPKQTKSPLRFSRLSSLYISGHFVLARGLKLFAQDWIHTFWPLAYLCSFLISIDSLSNFKKQWNMPAIDPQTQKKNPKKWSRLRYILAVSFFIITTSFQMASFFSLALVATPFIAIQCFVICGNFALSQIGHLSLWSSLHKTDHSTREKVPYAIKLGMRFTGSLIILSTGLGVLLAPAFMQSIMPIVLPCLLGWSVLWLCYKILMPFLHQKAKRPPSAQQALDPNPLHAHEDSALSPPCNNIEIPHIDEARFLTVISPASNPTVPEPSPSHDCSLEPHNAPRKTPDQSG